MNKLPFKLSSVFLMGYLSLLSCGNGVKDEIKPEPASGQVTAEPVNAPAKTWQEHWFDHNQLITRVFYNDELAVYYDGDVNRIVTWPNTYLADLWKYTKKTYGSFGAETRLYAIFHTGRYSGGHPSTYFDASHDYHNVIDCGPGPWTNGTENDIDLTTHEVAHIVEGASMNVKESPAFDIWGDSKWAEIFQYDVYKSLERENDRVRWFNKMVNNSDNFPRANTYWFRDWFYPIYSKYNETTVLVNFFKLLARNFPKSGTLGNVYARRMNMGEFVHFWSGAAGVNLKAQANTAFGWTIEWENQLLRAQQDFPGITYN